MEHVRQALMICDDWIFFINIYFRIVVVVVVTLRTIFDDDVLTTVRAVTGFESE